MGRWQLEDAGTAGRTREVSRLIWFFFNLLLTHDGPDTRIEICLQLGDRHRFAVEDRAVAGAADEFNDQIDRDEGIPVFDGGFLDCIIEYRRKINGIILAGENVPEDSHDRFLYIKDGVDLSLVS